MAEFIYKEKYKYLTNVCLNLTDACNLACRYCFVEQHPHFMTYDIAKDAVDWLINNLHIKKQNGWCSKDEKVFITYFGGEPTLLWDEIIVPLTIYIKENYKDEVYLSITTNCTLLNKERIDFLKQYSIFPLCSVDGEKETQDYNRPCHDGSSSFDKLIDNILYIKKVFPYSTFRSTIIPETADQLFKNYIFAEFLGFNSYFATPNSREIWSEEDIEVLKEQLQLIFEYRLKQFQDNIKPMDASFLNDVFTEILKRDITVSAQIHTKPLIRPGVERCGLGTSSGSISYDGTIYGCQEQPSKDEKNIFLIGNIYSGIDVDKHIKLLEEYNKEGYAFCEKPELCENCYFKTICHGYNCPSGAWDTYKNFKENSYVNCIWLQTIFKYSVITMKILKEENNELFNIYLNNDCNYNSYFKEEGGK